MAFCVVVCNVCVIFWEEYMIKHIIIIFDMCLYVNNSFKLASIM